MSIAAIEQAVKIIPSGVDGDLVVPAGASCLVMFAHGSGSSRHSSRNRYVAGVLQRSGIATLLLDLLTAAEKQLDRETAHLRFNVNLLADRLLEATAWQERESITRGLPLGYFGASTGAAAALIAAALQPSFAKAVVSRGGRPDLAGSAIPRVEAATLLIVGSLDHVVLRMNELTLAKLRCEKQLAIVRDATHLFEEPGTLEEVARLARDWFNQHLV